MVEKVRQKQAQRPEDGFATINEKAVDEISLDFFYKPHTITLLAISISIVIQTAFVR